MVQMSNKKIYIVEQYVSWNGHYKKYFENLISRNYNYLYCGKTQYRYPNAIFLKASYKTEKNHSFFNFVRGRFLDSFKAYYKLIQLKVDCAHLIEFEPFSFFLILLFRSAEIPRLIVTVHSVQRMTFDSILKDSISLVQRKIYRYTLRRLAKNNSVFVTHYCHHKSQLLSVIGERYEHSIRTINYPCPTIKAIDNTQKRLLNGKLLIHGQIREDKGVYEFLTSEGAENLNITIAGRILDTRILSIQRPGLVIINKFIEEEHLENLLGTHDFMLLPYSKKYSGGAGTLKDSLSYGLPVIVSDIPIFREVIQEGQVGFVYKNILDIEKLCLVNRADYNVLVDNCIAYATKFSWNHMREEYFKIYEEFTEKLYSR